MRRETYCARASRACICSELVCFLSDNSRLCCVVLSVSVQSTSLAPHADYRPRSVHCVTGCLRSAGAFYCAIKYVGQPCIPMYTRSRSRGLFDEPERCSGLKTRYEEATIGRCDLISSSSHNIVQDMPQSYITHSFGGFRQRWDAYYRVCVDE